MASGGHHRAARWRIWYRGCGRWIATMSSTMWLLFWVSVFLVFFFLSEWVFFLSEWVSDFFWVSGCDASFERVFFLFSTRHNFFSVQFKLNIFSISQKLFSVIMTESNTAITCMMNMCWISWGQCIADWAKKIIHIAGKSLI